jgi:hypothetical protein
MLPLQSLKLLELLLQKKRLGTATFKQIAAAKWIDSYFFQSATDRKLEFPRISARAFVLEHVPRRQSTRPRVWRNQLALSRHKRWFRVAAFFARCGDDAKAAARQPKASNTQMARTGTRSRSGINVLPAFSVQERQA